MRNYTRIPLNHYVASCGDIQSEPRRSPSEAANEIAGKAIYAEHGGWGQKITSHEKVGQEMYCSLDATNVFSSSREINTPKGRKKLDYTVQKYRVYCQFDNPSPLQEHQERSRVIKQSIEITIFGAES
jgi:hypothetical protein